MMIKDQFRCVTAAPGAVGIVVRNAPTPTSPSRAAAFVWGTRSTPAPSLPFGRWKTAVRPAA
jgi:hypothetical protein